MKTVLLLITCSIFLWFINPGAERGSRAKNISSLRTEPIDFKKQVQPILQNNCSPCHFPGGKLYEKLPFDKAETIINHEAGILKRIKKEEEVALIKKFVAENKP